MDNKLIAQYGTEILSYRLRTARHKKRAQKEDAHKKLIALDREKRRLQLQSWNLGWEPLFPPVQKGWRRQFVLRPDVARGRHADFFAGILRKINTVDYHPRKDFTRKKGRKRWKKSVVRPQALKRLHRSEFERLSEKEKQFFYPQTRIEKWSREPVVRYVFNEPWRLVLRVSPNMIDKVRRVDLELEASIERINQYLDRRFLRQKLEKLRSGCAWYSRTTMEEELFRWRYPSGKKPVARMIEEAMEENI